VQIENNAQIFGMLALNRIDAAVALDLVGDRLLREQPSLAIEKLAPPLLEEEFYVPVSKKFYAANREFAERFWQVMSELRDVTYTELAPNYLF
jgi:ABC-type amino acid transport substrate-binding protein